MQSNRKTIGGQVYLTPSIKVKEGKEMRKEEMNNEIRDVIFDCGLWIMSDGHVYAKRKPNKKQRMFMEEHKEEIIEELKRIREEEEAKGANKEQAKKQLKERFENGEIKAKVRIRNEENYSYYTIDSDMADILYGTGLVKYTSNGIEVPEVVVNALGMEFSYQQVKDYLEKRKARKEALKKKLKEKEQEAFEEAKRTGHEILIDQMYVPCDGSVEECNLDILIKYAMPDGTTKIVRRHTF